MTQKEAESDATLRMLAKACYGRYDAVAEAAFDDRCEELMGYRIRDVVARLLFISLLEARGRNDR